MWQRLKNFFRLFIIGIILLGLLSNSGIPSKEFTDQVRTYTRQIEFDYVSWVIDALWRKAAQAALGTGRYATVDQQQTLIQFYRDLVQENRRLDAMINQIYADPDVIDPESRAADYLARQRTVQKELKHVGLLAESVLQQQVSSVLADFQLTTMGQPIPPVQYHTTELPLALIVSPRDVIRQIADISLLPDLTLDQITALEKKVEQELNVSALVVPVGGVGVYPTMVMETSDVNWLAEVVTHEWTHNFLTLRPLGVLYYETPELRIINETTASIAGVELGKATISMFYPQFAPPPEPEQPEEEQPPTPSEPQVQEFDYRAEMRETRVTVDTLLAEGKVEEAENYMEQRRQFFVANGYAIRRLNQAYFAFYGAYADQPGGAAGEDPVGAAVRNLRAQSESLSRFLHRIAWVTSFERLLSLVNAP